MKSCLGTEAVMHGMRERERQKTEEKLVVVDIRIVVRRGRGFYGHGQW